MSRASHYLSPDFANSESLEKKSRYVSRYVYDVSREKPSKESERVRRGSRAAGSKARTDRVVQFG